MSGHKDDGTGWCAVCKSQRWPCEVEEVQMDLEDFKSALAEAHAREAKLCEERDALHAKMTAARAERDAAIGALDKFEKAAAVIQQEVEALVADNATLMDKMTAARAERDKYVQALGMLSCLAPSMEIDTAKPLGMAAKIVSVVDALSAEVMDALHDLARVEDVWRFESDDLDELYDSLTYILAGGAR